MKILFLASNFISKNHTVSHELVLGSLIRECSNFCDVFLATTHTPDIKKKKYSFFNFLGDFFHYLKKRKQIFNMEYRFEKERELEDLLKIKEMDYVILFWDTYFDLLNFQNKKKVITYSAKPRFSNAKSKLKSHKFFYLNIKNILNFLNILLLEKMHYSRYKNFFRNFNICNIDSLIAQKNGVKCRYLNNTWPNFFSKNILNQRKKIKRKYVNVLVNIGNINSTGNQIGIKYFFDNILPFLKKDIRQKKIKVIFCGSGDLFSKYTKDQLKYIEIKGFVKDLDAEIKESDIFLLCNNVGYHYGGYTRVAYFMSSGAPLIAHKNLSKSMPELQHNYNCMLSENKFDMYKYLKELIENKRLRNEISANALRTYSEIYAPKIVIKKLLNE